MRAAGLNLPSEAKVGHLAGELAAPAINETTKMSDVQRLGDLLWEQMDKVTSDGEQGVRRRLGESIGACIFLSFIHSCLHMLRSDFAYSFTFANKQRCTCE